MTSPIQEPTQCPLLEQKMLTITQKIARGLGALHQELEADTKHVFLFLPQGLICFSGLEPDPEP